jgi:hypothetical protein
MKGYSTSINVASAPNDVFKNITDVSNWWVRLAAGVVTVFEGKSSNLNDEFILRHSDIHYSKHKLTEVVPGEKVVWLVTGSRLAWIKENKEEWTGTKMIFEIIPDVEKTRVIFTHEGLVPQLECYEHCVHFWDRVIGEWLFNFITDSAVKRGI